MNQKKRGGMSYHHYSDRLKKKLNLLTASQAIVIEAPSGYGKSTAIRDYFEDADLKGEYVHWFTAVDEAPMALYRRFCSEIEKIDSHAGKFLRDIDFPNAFTIGEACDALRSIKCSCGTWLVIDDFQFLFAVLPQTFFTAMLDHGKDDLHIVIITQSLGQDFISAVTGHGIPHITSSDLQWDSMDIRRYFSMAGAKISMEVAHEVKEYTGGWVIAVHLQLCSYQETGTFSDKAILLLMENLIWNKITSRQQDFLLRAFVFETYTIERIRRLLNCVTLPDYVTECLSIPFIYYIAEQQRYEPHAILIDMVRVKRRERGASFERECMEKAGDICRDEGDDAGAVVYYSQIKEYGKILSLDLAHLICTEIGERMFSDIALEVAQNCPLEIRREYPLSMLHVAWAVRLADNEAEFHGIMDELDTLLPGSGLLRAEWLLLSAYIYYPELEKMLPNARRAAEMFEGTSSRVILPEVPWAFYEYTQITAFHNKIGAADQEADLLEEYINIYACLTGGHGNGADALFRAEIAFLRGETSKAEIFAHKAAFIAGNRRQKIIQIGAARLLATIALLKADADGWQKALNSIERVASGAVQNSSLLRAVLDVVRGTLLVELKDLTRIADWLKNEDFLSQKLPDSLSKNAVGVYAFYLIGQGDIARLIGQGQARSIEKHSVYSKHVYYLMMAVGYSLLGDRAQSAECCILSAKQVLPDGMIHYFAGFSPFLQGIPDELIENSYPKLFARYKDYKEQYIVGWFKLFNANTAGELPSGLTEREREIAVLAADGLRNNEIAERLFVSENTVRAHLRSIYQKLDIDRRARLAGKLK